MKSHRLSAIALSVSLALSTGSAVADLARVGPLNVPSPPGNGFPLWYQDLNGLVLDLCLPNANDPGRLQETACLLGPPQPPAPFTFPTTFPDESFYFRAVSDPLDVGGKRAILVLALEAAFANGAPRAGDQMVFTRIRVTSGVPEDGTYTVYHPYGIETFPDVTAGVGNRDITFTDDVGITAGNFSDALHSRVGPILVPGDGLGNPLPQASWPVINGVTFLSDPGAAAPTVPIALAPFKDENGTPINYFQICGTRADGSPIPLGIAGPTGLCARIDTFALTGRVHDSIANPIGSPLAINDVTYSRDSSGTHVDVSASVVKVLPSQPNPLLSAASNSVPSVRMAGPTVLGNYYAQGITDPAGAHPGPVTVINSADNPPTAVTANPTDVVSIASASWDPSGIITVVATTSDKGFGSELPPQLTLSGFAGATANAGGISGDPASVTLVASGVTIPPAQVAVMSAAGGIGRADLVKATAPAFPGGVVFARDDAADATAGGEAVAIPVLANDLANASAPPNAGPVAIVAPGLVPSIGSLLVNADGTVSFTPGAVTGTTTFRYTVANSVGMSNPATVTITVAPPKGGPVPIANPDTGPNNVNMNAATTINVLANDSGNGGTLEPTSVAVVGATGGTAVANANGTVTYTAGAAAGTFGFDYTVTNTNGNVSSPAHVTITILNPEQINITPGAQCKRAGNAGDWTVRGTSSVSTGNSITVYKTALVPAAPTAAQTVGTVPVVNGAWQLQVKGGVSCAAAPATTMLYSLQSTIGTKRENQTAQVR